MDVVRFAYCGCPFHTYCRETGHAIFSHMDIEKLIGPLAVVKIP